MVPPLWWDYLPSIMHDGSLPPGKVEKWGGGCCSGEASTSKARNPESLKKPIQLSPKRKLEKMQLSKMLPQLKNKKANKEKTKTKFGL